LNLDRWVKDGVMPPPSRYPRVDDGTLVPMIAQDGKIPGFTLARAPNSRPRLDYGPDYEQGVIGKVLPAVRNESYGILVPRVDGDGNDVTGVRLPDIVVPTGTATGWSVRGPGSGGEGELCYLDGSFVPFVKTKAEREATGDVRPSLTERYGNQAAYLTRLEQAAIALAHNGYMLNEDVPRILMRARAVTW
jgi:hypothetical protein